MEILNKNTFSDENVTIEKKKGDTRVRKQRSDKSEGEKSKLKNATRARSESEKMRTAKQFARGRKKTHFAFASRKGTEARAGKAN
jgi:hypothetical protein